MVTFIRSDGTIKRGLKIELIEKEKKRERKNRVIKLHIEGKLQREIAADERMSLSFVTAVTKPLDKAISRILDGPGDENLAVALFAKGRDRIYVHRNLNLEMAEVDRIYYGCSDWIKEDGIRNIRKKVGEEHFSQLLQLCNIMIEKNKKPEDIVLISDSIDNILLLREELNGASEDLYTKMIQRNDLNLNIERLQNDAREKQFYLNSLNAECSKKEQKINMLEEKLYDLQSKIEKIMNENEYRDFVQNVVKGVAEECKQILSDLNNKYQIALNYLQSKEQVEAETLTKISEEMAITIERLKYLYEGIQCGEWNLKLVNSDQSIVK